MCNVILFLPERPKVHENEEYRRKEISGEKRKSVLLFRSSQFN